MAETSNLFLDKAPSALRPALAWFHAMRGQEIGWPSPSPVAGTPHVVTSAKGIYKPEGSEVALSVRQTLSSPYADRPVTTREDGTWVYAYHQEGTEPTERDSDFTNVGLMKNIATGSPVAVLVQTQVKPRVLYRVLGLAVVTRWSEGFFYLEGFGELGQVHTEGWRSEDEVLDQQARELASGEESPSDGLDPAYDARVRVRTDIVRRQGQGKFRNQLLEAYEGRCAVTGCSISAVLDAAHIQPYMGPHTNHPSNGLLLRTDLHNLMDSGLLAFDPATRCVTVARGLSNSEYGTLHGARIFEPAEESLRPLTSAFQAHLDWCGERLY